MATEPQAAVGVARERRGPARAVAPESRDPGVLPDHDVYRARRTFGACDGWRFMSILGVVWYHCRGGIEIGNVGQQGYMGVAMFFVLSGFLIMTLLLREQAHTGSISLRSFYARRSLRIMPLYYGVVLATAFVVFVFLPGGPAEHGMRRDLPYMLTYTTNWVFVGGFLAISWSLSAEEQFYLVAPALQKYARGAVWVFLALLLVQELIDFRLLDDILVRFGHGPHSFFMLRATGFAPILLGVLLAHLLHHPGGFRLFSRAFGHRLAPLPIALALIACLELMPVDKHGWPKLAIFSLMAILIGSTVVREDHVLAPFLRWRPIARIGVVSYGVYLLHLPVAMLIDIPVQRYAWPDAVRLALVLAGSVLAAELTYRYYETPFLRLKARFAR